MKTRNIQQCHLSKARDFRKCSFHLIWFLLFSEFLVTRKNVIQKTKKAEVDKQRNLDFFFSSSSASR